MTHQIVESVVVNAKPERFIIRMKIKVRQKIRRCRKKVKRDGLDETGTVAGEENAVCEERNDSGVRAPTRGVEAADAAS